MALSTQEKIYGQIAYSGIQLPDGSKLTFASTQDVASYVAKNGDFPANSIIIGSGGQTYAQTVTQFQNVATAQTAASSNTALDATSAGLGPNESVVASSQNTGKSVPANAVPLTANEADNIDPYNPNAWGSEGAPVPYTPNPAQQATLKKSTTASSNQPGGATAEDAKPKSTAGKSSADASVSYQSTANPLHNYSSYTYGLTLHALSSSDYSTLLNNPKNPKYTATLISSASRFHATRSQFFQDDFYFDEFKLSTIIGLNAQSRASNAIQMDFSIIEPYGMTLINRLLDLSSKTLQVENYLQIPYVLQLDFFGYDDNGNMANLTGMTKRFPIKLINMKIKAGVKGTEYRITAVPFGHQANFATTQAVPVQVEIAATTINDFFNSKSTDSATTASVVEANKQIDADKQRKQIQSIKIINDDNGNPLPDPGPPVKNAQPVTPPGTDKDQRKPDAQSGSGNTNSDTTPPPTIKTQVGFAAAYNAWYKSLEDRGDLGVADEIAFVIQEGKSVGVANAPPLGTALVSIPKKTDAAKTPLTNDKNTETRSNDAALNKTTPSLPINLINEGTYAINAGTTIQSVVDTIIVNSEYITSQLTDPQTDTANSAPIGSGENLATKTGKTQVYWYRIIPKVELKKFDSVRQTWGKKITYYIKPYIYYNTKDQRAPIAQLPNAVKDYEFLYTGKNIDVINFDMDFNALFFTAIQVDKKAKEVTGKTPGSNTTTPDKKTSKNNNQSKNQPLPVQQEMVINNTNNTSNGAIKDSNKQNAQSYKDSIYSQLNGDMLQLRLQILGDPDFIKQDDILFAPDSTGYTAGKQFVTADKGSSLNMDTGTIYCRVTFKTPTDFDQNTGLLTYYGSEQTAAFSGLYRVLKVDSEFRQGRFTQSLELVREFNQPEDSAKTQGNTAPRGSVTATDPSKVAKTPNSNTDKNAGQANNPRVPGGKNNNSNNTKIEDTSPALLPRDPFAEENAPPGNLGAKSASTQRFDDGSSLYTNPNAVNTGGFSTITTGAPEATDLADIATSAPTVPISNVTSLLPG